MISLLTEQVIPSDRALWIRPDNSVLQIIIKNDFGSVGPFE